ncbi:uncharacterized protein LOC125560641 isoform X2 [Nematostella vectensis]|uniref:uncharacterized protein LOC125560641 isoform X2 n=1 Tax=Nematostella vectensis TaxID=45351 RepID=UPI002076DF37|nr:uncharacterized protein LOC125560641 isoform X2 [Nematostella vectensis]
MLSPSRHYYTAARLGPCTVDKKLDQFHTRSLRAIMRIRWQDRITNIEVLDRADTTSIEAKILQAQLRWSGHVIRMEESRIPRQVFYSELASGYRKKGRPKKRYKDNLKEPAGVPSQVMRCSPLGVTVVVFCLCPDNWRPMPHLQPHLCIGLWSA